MREKRIKLGVLFRIPREFQRRGGRKRIVAPDGSEIMPTSEPQPDGRLVKALARAHRWQRVLEEGHFATLAELAHAERISCPYVCRVLRLMLFTPEIVERSSMAGLRVGLPQLLRPFPVEWRQRQKFCRA